MSKATDIMNIDVISIDSESTVDYVIQLLAKNKISGLPVIDKDNKVIGMVTERDIINYSSKLHIIPLIGLSGWISMSNGDPGLVSVKERISILSNTNVQEVMSSIIISTKEDASWHDVLLLMKNNSVNRIPVISKDGKLLGIITRDDLLNYLASKN